jgi:osmotically-inducible protein OsmY
MACTASEVREDWLMRSDNDITQNVAAELQWSPDIDQTDIAVKVNRGVVNLAGYVRSFAEKCRAEAAVKRVAGVTAVANDLAVRLPLGEIPTDPEIARAAAAALKRQLPLKWEGIQPVVHEGHVSLEGTAEWHFEREQAEIAVRGVPGVISVRNSIRLKPKAAATEIKHQIEQAFQRSAAIDAQHVSVEAHGDQVTLRGEVRSWAERDEAQRTAWSAPGVVHVVNEIVIRT